MSAEEPRLGCSTSPCPYCTVGIPHSATRDEVLHWWQCKAQDWVTQTMREADPREFVVQFMAVRHILTSTSCHMPGTAPSSSGGSSAVSHSLSSVGIVPHSLVPALEQVSTSAFRSEPNPWWGWQYRTGERGEGMWLWLDDNIAAVVDAAYRSGTRILTLRGEDEWTYVYDFNHMERTDCHLEHERVGRPIRMFSRTASAATLPTA